MSMKLKTVFFKFRVVLLIVVPFCLANAGQAHSALRNLRTEFDTAFKKLDVDKINSLIKEGFHADDGVYEVTKVAIAVSLVVRGTDRGKNALEIEERYISIIKSLSKAGGDFKYALSWLAKEKAMITNPILTAFLEAGANPSTPNNYDSSTKPIFYETISNWETGQEFVQGLMMYNIIEDTKNSFSNIRTNLTRSEIPPLLAKALNDEVKQVAMFLSNEEVIERMKILVKYKAKLTWGDFFKDFEKPVMEFFMQEFFRLLKKKSNIKRAIRQMMI